MEPFEGLRSLRFFSESAGGERVPAGLSRCVFPGTENPTEECPPVKGGSLKDADLLYSKNVFVVDRPLDFHGHPPILSWRSDDTGFVSPGVERGRTGRTWEEVKRFVARSQKGVFCVGIFGVARALHPK